MTFDAYDVGDDPYVYAGTDCLKNRLGLRDTQALSAFELEISTLRAEEALPVGRFSPTHYRAVHRHLFQDVYAWAGHYRTVRTGKGGNWFCYPENIHTEMAKLFQRLRTSAFLPGSADAEFLDAVTDFLAYLNAIHPYRDGNGRAQLAFINLLGFRAGHPMDFSRVQPSTFMPAMIASFAGQTDPLKAELAALRA